jgi:hypothetical protein
MIARWEVGSKVKKLPTDDKSEDQIGHYVAKEKTA